MGCIRKRNFWEFWEVVSGTAEEIEVGEYGFRTEATAFGDDTCPTNVFLMKYKGKFTFSRKYCNI